MYFNQNQRGDISILKGSSLKLVDKFTYPGNSVSSTENDIDALLVKVWKALDKLSVIRKSDQSDKIKCDFSEQQSCPYYNIDVARGR